MHLQVNAAYETGRGKVQGLEGIATEVAGAASRSVAGLESAGAITGSNGLAAGSALTTGKQPGVPPAYLNYLVYDTDFQLVDQGFVQVSQEAATQVGSRSADGEGETLALDVDIAQNGYLYAYLSHEAEASGTASVYFDDFTVEHEGISIVQHNDYYAFGAVYQQSADRVLNNAYLYQGKELQDGLGLDLYDFHARQYDPLLGRMNSVDPMAASFDGMSPYAGMGNNPISIVDPTGEYLMLFSLKYALIGAGVGGLAGGVIAETQGKDFWKGFGYGAAIGFAAAGFAGSDFAKANIWETHAPSGLVPQKTGLFKGRHTVSRILNGTDYGKAPVKKLLFDTPLLPNTPNLPGLDLPVSKLLEVTNPHFNPPPTDGVNMVDAETIFGNSVPNLQPQIATGQNILRNIARYLNVVNQTGQPPQSISISGVNTNFANRTYTSTLKQGNTIVRSHPTSSILRGRLDFIQQELIRLGAPTHSVTISPSPTYRFGVNSSQIYFNYGN